MTLIIKSIELSTGIRLPYVEQGGPAGIPLILLHGSTDSWHSFEPLLPHLPASLHVFALTQRGHGDATQPIVGYRTRDFASDLAAFVDAMGLDSVVLVGHSMGSTNALRFALDHPDRTRALVLVGAFATYRHNAAVVEFWESAVSQLTDPIDPDFVREFQASTLAQSVPEAFFDTTVQESLKVPARVWQAMFQGLLEDDFADDLGKINIPTLIVWGAQDTFCRQGDQEVLLAKLSPSRLVVYERAGHAVHWEEPARVAEDMAIFVRSLENHRIPATHVVSESP